METCFSVERGGRTYSYLSGKALPALVLAVREHPEYPGEYRFREPTEWLRIAHDSAGNASHHHYFWARELAPRQATWRLMRELAGDASLQGLGFMEEASLDEVLAYRARLQALGMDCNQTFRELEEALYPIDCDAAAVRIASETEVPDDLYDLVESDSGPTGWLRGVRRWGLYMLTSNS